MNNKSSSTLCLCFANRWTEYCLLSAELEPCFLCICTSYIYEPFIQYWISSAHNINAWLVCAISYWWAIYDIIIQIRSWLLQLYSTLVWCIRDYNHWLHYQTKQSLYITIKKFLTHWVQSVSQNSNHLTICSI